MSTRRHFIRQAGSLTAIAILPDSRWWRPFKAAKAVKIAIVGMGRQGRAIATELLKIENVELTALCEIIPDRLQANLTRFPGTQGFTSLKELLTERPEITAVCIATPTHRHREPLELALAAGKHIYLEAPIGHTPEECRALVDAVTRMGSEVIVATGFPARSNPLYQRARTLARTDSLRQLITVTAQSRRKSSWRFPVAGGSDRDANWRLDPAVSTGLAGELGSIQIDTAAWYRGRYPRRITGFGKVLVHRDGREVADTATAVLEWDDAVVMSWDATLGSSFGGQMETFVGVNAAIRLSETHGWLFKEADAPTQGWEVYATRQQFHTDEGIVLVADATKLAEQGRLKEGGGLPYSPLYYTLADFIRRQEGDSGAGTDIFDGARSSIAGILANRAIVTGQPVAISADPLEAD